MCHYYKVLLLTTRVYNFLSYCRLFAIYILLITGFVVLPLTWLLATNKQGICYETKFIFINCRSIGYGRLSASDRRG
ncbi:hypothetical protein ALTERO38_90104 [Alteromonas sp. 38]|nr:hypothetical protein ALTER154_10344 [Alteromonas sp. 154]VXC47967.1 hypothetical protein ALTERO38_90104 [Alteromonas sp. 38]